MSLQQDLKNSDDARLKQQLDELAKGLDAQQKRWFAKESRDERNLIVLLVGMMVVALAIVAKLMLAQK